MGGFIFITVDCLLIVAMTLAAKDNAEKKKWVWFAINCIMILAATIMAASWGL